MASAIDSSGQTTRARSIVTHDGYVSRGRAPPSSVPRDHAMLQDFAVYLELRLKSQNLCMLRRIFADFLNEQEKTLGPMMRQGCTIVTIFPVLRTSVQRRQQAELLLAKPKWPLDTRGCVFLYLQYRTATRNMALLKHLFLQFVGHRETALLDFVQRGCQVISVIPFELPQMLPPVCLTPPVQQVTSDVVQKRKRRRTSSGVASPAAQVEEQKEITGRHRGSETGETTTAIAGGSIQQQDGRATGEFEAAEAAQEARVAHRKKTKGRSRRPAKNGEATAAIAEASAWQQDALAPDDTASVQVEEVHVAKKRKTGRHRRVLETKEATTAIEDSALLRNAAAPTVPEGAAVDAQVEVKTVPQKKKSERSRRTVKIGETVAPTEAEGAGADAQIEEETVPQKKKSGRSRRTTKIGMTSGDSAQQHDAVAPTEPGGPVQIGELQMDEKKTNAKSPSAAKIEDTSAAIAADPAQQHDVVASDDAASVEVGAVQTTPTPKRKRGRPRRLSQTSEDTAAIADDSALQQNEALPTEPEGAAAETQIEEVKVPQERSRRTAKIGEISDGSAQQQDAVAPTEAEGVAASVQVGELQMDEKKTNAKSPSAAKIEDTSAAIAADPAQQHDVVASDDAASVEVGAVQTTPTPKRKRGRPRRLSQTSEDTAAIADDSALQQNEALPTEPEGAAAETQIEEVKVPQERSRRTAKIGETSDGSAQQQDAVAPTEAEGVAASVQVGELQMDEKKTNAKSPSAAKIEDNSAAIAADPSDPAQQQNAVILTEPDGDIASVQVEVVQVTQTRTEGVPGCAMETREATAAIADLVKQQNAVVPEDTAAAITDDSLQQHALVTPMDLEDTAASVRQEEAADIEAPEKHTAFIEYPDDGVASDRSDDVAAGPGDATAAIEVPDGDKAVIQHLDDEVAPIEDIDAAAAIAGPRGDDAVMDGPDDAAALAQPEEPEIVTDRRRKHSNVVPVRASSGNEEPETEVAAGSRSAAVSTLNHDSKPKAIAARDESKDTSVATPTEPADASVAESPRPLKAKRGRKHKVESTTPIKEKSHKRGKPAMSEDMCRSQLELTRKMEPFEAQIPWEAVFSNLPAPFDEPKHPALSRKFRKFWRNHARAVWERKFWAPMSRKTSLLSFNKRNNRQLTAKNAFESVIISAYKELGAEFFVMLDTQKPRHPGWWYRGPVVALFSLQQIKDENAVWDYVTNEALKRFPDCKLALPLKAPNSGAVSKRHTRESDSMWMDNHQLASEIILAITALKSSQKACEKTEATNPNNVMTVMDSLALL